MSPVQLPQFGMSITFLHHRYFVPVLTTTNVVEHISFRHYEKDLYERAKFYAKIQQVIKKNNLK